VYVAGFKAVLRNAAKDAGRFTGPLVWCAPGRMTRKVGPNGAGKTTTMRIVLGVLEADRGEVRWRGRPVDAETRRRFGTDTEQHRSFLASENASSTES
jgi:ABC-type transport system involved in cytochrome c biogenesis ATPase subunit